jgi:hypothetical protein
MAGYLVMAWAVLKRPILTLPVVAAYIGLLVWLGPHEAHGLVAWAAIGLVVWRVVHRRSFERIVWARVGCSWRRLWVFQRRWRSTMVMCGLSKRYKLRDSVPWITKVQSTAWADRVLIRLVLGSARRTSSVPRPSCRTASAPARVASAKTAPRGCRLSSRPPTRSPMSCPPCGLRRRRPARGGDRAAGGR